MMNVQPQTTITKVSDDLRHHLVDLANQDLKAGDLYDLRDLEHSASEAAKTLASIKSRVNAELQRRYEDQIKALLKAKPDPYGIVTLEVDGFKVKADLTKKVEWNETALATKFEELQARGLNASDYIELSYSLPEKRFSALPADWQGYFSDARTVSEGSLKITLEQKAKE